LERRIIATDPHKAHTIADIKKKRYGVMRTEYRERRMTDNPPSTRHLQCRNNALRTSDHHAACRNVANGGRSPLKPDLLRHAPKVGITRSEAIHVDAI